MSRPNHSELSGGDRDTTSSKRAFPSCDDIDIESLLRALDDPLGRRSRASDALTTSVEISNKQKETIATLNSMLLEPLRIGVEALGNLIWLGNQPIEDDWEDKKVQLFEYVSARRSAAAGQAAMEGVAVSMSLSAHALIKRSIELHSRSRIAGSSDMSEVQRQIMSALGDIPKLAWTWQTSLDEVRANDLQSQPETCWTICSLRIVDSAARTVHVKGESIANVLPDLRPSVTFIRH